MKLVEQHLKSFGYNYVIISTEILAILNKKDETKDFNFDSQAEIFKFLDSKFDNILLNTFNEPIVFCYTEVINREIVKLIHEYFSNKSCNIQNIILVTATSGLDSYYKKYCELNCCLGFTVLEIWQIHSMDEKYLLNLKPKNFNKQLTKIFSFYGGTYDPYAEKTFLTLFMSQYSDIASVEMIGKTSTREELLKWLEKETFFIDYSFVEKHLQLYDQYVNQQVFDKTLSLSVDKDPITNESFGTGNYQEVIDQNCLFNICRETTNFEPFSYVSEKTFRCFYNHLIPLPTSGKFIIEDLKNYGFWIDESIVDYSYLQETFFKDKMNGLANSIEKISKITLDELTDYYYQNKSNFEHNQQLVIRWAEKLEKTFNDKFKNL